MKGSVTRDRILPLNGALNFRDLGGYPTVEGRVTRWGRMFRSDTLHAITSEDLVTLRSLDIRTVIDLRPHGEIAYTGRGLLGRSSISLIEADAPGDAPPAFSTVASVGDAPLHDVYWHYLTSGPAKYVRALQELGRPEIYPVVVSCFFGKDRTGVLVALVLACAGVQRDAIVEDYTLSATRMGYIVERLQRDPVYNDTLEQTPDWRLSAPSATMLTFLERLDEYYGGARSWALRAGLTEVQLENLRSALLE